jgi:hypothetical protein
MNYNNRIFRGKTNSANGEVSESTCFHYRQSADRIWADYAGGDIVTGHLQGKVFADGSLEFVYHHENMAGDLMAGKCRSVPHQNSDGKVVLKENWQWFTGDQTTGSSEVEEVLDES